MSTLRSRGSDISATPLPGSTRISMIVSERGFRPSFLSPCRRSEPAIRIVWGFPLSTGVSSCPVFTRVNFCTVRSKKSNALDVVANADTATIPNAAMTERFSMWGQRSSDAQVRFAGQALGDEARELDECLTVALERGQRDPFGGAVVAGAAGAVFDRGHARLAKADRVRGTVAADADRLRVEELGGTLAQHLHERVVALHDRGHPVELRDHVDAFELGDLRSDRSRVLSGQITDVDVDGARVGHLVERVAAKDAAEVDRGTIEEIRALAGEGERLDRAEDVERLEDRVVAQPGRRAVGGSAAHLQPKRQNPLGLHPDVEIGGLAGDR